MVGQTRTPQRVVESSQPTQVPTLFAKRPHMDSKLLEILVCPVTKGALTYNADANELVSRSARLAYPVRDGIPVLLENEARTLSDAELDALHASPAANGA